MYFWEATEMFAVQFEGWLYSALKDFLLKQKNPFLLCISGDFLPCVQGLVCS